MPITMNIPTDPVRLLLIGAPAGEFRLAAQMARDSGAEVAMADTPDAGMALLRRSAAALVMIDVEADVAGFMQSLRAERFAVPVIACGIDAPADRAVAAIRAGARDYVPLPPQRDLIAAAIASAARLPAAVMIGEAPALLRAATFGRAMAPSDAPILIVGEPGTGRETMGRAIHAASGRGGRFVDIECAGIAPDISAAELFGHGERRGRVAQAAGGTLFIRDVDRLDPAAQARLTEVLRPADVRLIAATSVDLDAAVARGTFRAGLRARLSAARINLPPLRDRTGDIPALARHFIATAAAAAALPAPSITADALAQLVRHRWPDNVRELADVIQRAVAITRGGAIDIDALVLADGAPLAAAPRAASDAEAEVTGLVGRTVEDVERALILRTLERCRGNRTSASGILGISVRTMRNKLKTFIEAGITVAPAI